MGASAAVPHKLSRDEKDLIKKSWAIVMQHEERVAIEIFLRVFQRIDGTLNLFERLARFKNLDEVKASTEMKAHCIRVTAILSTVIEQLDQDQSCTIEMFRNIGRTHYRLGNDIGPAHYEEFCNIFIGILAEELGAKFDPKTRAAWTNAFEGVKTTLETTKHQLEARC